MKFKRLTAVFTAAVMAFSMATAASAEDDFNGTVIETYIFDDR